MKNIERLIISGMMVKYAAGVPSGNFWNNIGSSIGSGVHALGSTIGSGMHALGHAMGEQIGGHPGSVAPAAAPSQPASTPPPLANGGMDWFDPGHAATPAAANKPTAPVGAPAPVASAAAPAPAPATPPPPAPAASPASSSSALPADQQAEIERGNAIRNSMHGRSMTDAQRTQASSGLPFRNVGGSDMPVVGGDNGVTGNQMVALFQRYHGSQYDPNSPMDRAKMQQLIAAHAGGSSGMLQAADAPWHRKMAALIAVSIPGA